MNPHLLKRLFPNASKAVLAANAGDYGTGKPDDPPRAKVLPAKSEKRPPALEGSDAGEAQSARCPHVCFTLFRNKLLDVDATHGCCKDLLDGLRYAGLVDGDREGEITFEVRQERVKRADEMTVIEITYHLADVQRVFREIDSRKP